jgi:hypothetical protein
MRKDLDSVLTWRGSAAGFPWAGTLLLSAAPLAMVGFAASQLPRWNHHAGTYVVMLTVGLALLGLVGRFAMHEIRAGRIARTLQAGSGASEIVWAYRRGRWLVLGMRDGFLASFAIGGYIGAAWTQDEVRALERDAIARWPNATWGFSPAREARFRAAPSSLLQSDAEIARGRAQAAAIAEQVMRHQLAAK